MIIADFSGGRKTAYAEGLWQWDYGQVLRIQGLNLPTAVEIHFSLSETGGTAITRIGLTEDHVTDVVIPDAMLENELKTTNYRVYVFIYLADEQSGETVYQVICTVKARPKPEAWHRTADGDIFREALKKINEIVDREEAAAEMIRMESEAIAGNTLAVQQALEEISAIGQAVAENSIAAEEAKNQAESAKTIVEENALAVQEALEEISAIGQAVAEASTAVEEAKNQAEAAKTAAETAQLEAQKQAAIAAEKAAQLNNATAVTDLFEVIDGVLYIR